MAFHEKRRKRGAISVSDPKSTQKQQEELPLCPVLERPLFFPFPCLPEASARVGGCTSPTGSAIIGHHAVIQVIIAHATLVIL